MSCIKNKTCKMDQNTCAVFMKHTKKQMSTILHLTDRCNESCEYCWHKDKLHDSSNDMKIEHIDNLYHFIKKEFPDHLLSFSFMGGEPSLVLDIVRYTINKITSNEERYTFLYLTNLVIIPDENTLDLFKKSNVKLVVSIPKHSSKLYLLRKNNIIKLLKKYDGTIIFNYVLNEHDDIEDMIKTWYTEVGITEMGIVVEYGQYNFREDLELYKKELTHKLKMIYSSPLNKYGKYHTTSKIHPYEFIKDETKKPCEYENINVSYFANGKFYQSTRDKFFNNDAIGDIKNGIDFDKLRDYYKSIPCFNCPERFKNCSPDPASFMSNNIAHDNKTSCIGAMIRRDIKYNTIDFKR